jgi:hypothetical protein
MKMLNVAMVVALTGLVAVSAANAQAAKKDTSMAMGKSAAKPASHMAQAKTHLAEAIKEGQAGKADGLVTHAKMAQEHLTAADKEKSTEHTQAALKSLQDAIDKGTAGNAADGTKAAQEAMNHLNMKAAGGAAKGGAAKGSMKKAG